MYMLYSSHIYIYIYIYGVSYLPGSFAAGSGRGASAGRAASPEIQYCFGSTYP